MLKFRRTKSSDVLSSSSMPNYRLPDRSTSHDPAKPPRSLGGRMKKSAPPPPSSTSSSGGGGKVGPSHVVHQVPVVPHNPDDSAINELLEGRMELTVNLPGEKSVKMMVERRMPMMDLLVQVTSANKINPSGHVIHVMTERGNDFLHYKPSTPIGSLDTNVIHVLPKNAVILPPVKKLPKVNNQPFEQTFRLQVNLPRNQLTVLRVSPRYTLADIHKMSCEEKALEPSKYDLRHPNHLDEPLDLNTTLSQYGLNEICLVSKKNLCFHTSTPDILTYRTKEDEKKKKGLFGFQWKRRSKTSLDSQGEDPNSRGASPSRSDSSSGGGYTSSDARSTSPNRPLSYHEEISVTSRPVRPHKKRQAPLPPQLPSTSQNSVPVEEISAPVEEKIASKQTAPLVSHSRHSSDSSGYHESSVLSDALDSMPTTQSSSPTTSIETDLTNSTDAIHSSTPMNKNLKSSFSCPNVSVAGIKKRKAPLPPPVHDEIEDIDAQLQVLAKEQIEECSKDSLQTYEADNECTPEKYDQVTNEEPTVSVRRLSLSSHDTSSDVEACYDQTITEVEKMMNFDELDETSGTLQYCDHTITEDNLQEISEAPPSPNLNAELDISKEKRIFQEESVDTLVSESEQQFYSAVKEMRESSTDDVKHRSDSDVSTSSSVRTCVTDCSQNTVNTIEPLDETPQIFETPESEPHFPHTPEPEHEPQNSDLTDIGPKNYESPEIAPNEINPLNDLPQVMHGIEPLKAEYKTKEIRSDEVSKSSVTKISTHTEITQTQKTEKTEIKTKEARISSKPSFRIGTYSSDMDLSEKPLRAVKSEINSFSSHYSSMQDLSKEVNTTESTVAHEQVESTMRKVQSEVNLMVAQHNSQEKDEGDLQEHYDKLQEQLITWQKRLQNNEARIDTKPAPEQNLTKAETLPRVSKKPEKPDIAIERPARHKPSIKIGTWSDQKSDQNRQYKTEIKIQGEEVEEQQRASAALKNERPALKFSISHSKVDTDIFSNKQIDTPDAATSPKKVQVAPPASPKLNAAKSGCPEPIIERKAAVNIYSKPPQGIYNGRNVTHSISPVRSTWSRVDKPKNMPFFKTRGVTTNNRGELVVKSDRFDYNDMQNKAIQEAKNRVMEQVKHRVKEVSQQQQVRDENPDSRKCLLVESNKAPENVYIENKKNNSDVGKEIVNGVMVPQTPPPPPPPLPTIVPNNNNNLKKINSEITSNGINVTDASPTKRKPRKVIEPKLDAREELMLAIRNFGGRNTLRKV